MASILSLTDDCLHKLVPFLDLSSFHNFAVTCKKLAQVTSNNTVLPTNLLRAKAEYFIKRFVVENGDDDEKFSKFQDFLRESARLTGVKGMLTYDNVNIIWHVYAPVVAKLFTWYRDEESSVEEGKPTATCLTEHRKVTLHLPTCRKSMVIETSFFRDKKDNYDPELSIHVTCGDSDVTSQGFTRNSPMDYKYWEDAEVTRAVEPMKGVIELLQKELGETVPPITNRFFIWLCYFFPNEFYLDGALTLYFKDDYRNSKPTYTSVQPAIHEFHEYQQTEIKLQRLVAELNRDEDQRSNYSGLAAETVCSLSRRSETEILKKFEEDAPRFFGIVNDHDMQELPKQLLLDLILRTSLGERGYKPGPIVNRYVEGEASFRCFGGNVLEIHGSMRGDGESCPRWHDVALEVTFPDGKVLRLQEENKPLAIEYLTPVTELLQEGVCQRMQKKKQKKKHIPKISNLFSAVFFLNVLDLRVDFETFLGRYDKLISLDSEEEFSF